MSKPRSPQALTAPAFDRLLRPLKPAAQVGLAVSGGADSVALMVLASAWRDWLEAKGKTPPVIIVLTVDHGLRAEATAETRQVARWAKALNFKHKLLRWEGEKPTSNVQALARAARYQLLTDWARQGAECADLLVGHHLDDQAETFLMRLQRGSGVDGLAAMAPVAVKQGVRILRPLLDVPRARLVATLRKAGHDWIEDPSNEDERYLRVRVRQALPLLDDLGLSRERLTETARAMARARSALEEMTRAAEAASVSWHEEGYAVAGFEVFRRLSDEIALRLLLSVLKRVSGREEPARLQSLEGLLEVVRAGGLKAGRTLGGVKWQARGDELLAFREFAAIDEVPLTLAAGQSVLWDGRFRLFMPKVTRGALVRALGREGLVQAEAAGGTLPHTVPKSALEGLPGLWVAEQLVAQPQLGVRLAGGEGFEALFVGGRAIF